MTCDQLETTGGITASTVRQLRQIRELLSQLRAAQRAANLIGMLLGMPASPGFVDGAGLSQVAGCGCEL
jgi:hypothetical protein